jgi:hypothetical protein
MLTLRVLGPFVCVLLFGVLCRMKKTLRRVKNAFMAGSPSHNSSSRTRSNSMLLDSSWFVSYVPSLYGAEQSSYLPTQARGMIEDDTDA